MVVPDICSVFSPGIAPFVSTLLNDGKVGICHGGARLDDVNSGMSGLAESCMDRFKVVLPHAGCSVTWEVLFNSQYPEDPPDFIFDSDEQDFFPNLENVKSLTHWNPDQPDSLLRVIEELLKEYCSHQRELLAKSARLQFEYGDLLNEKYKEDDIEIHISQKSKYRIGPVNFLIKMPIDFSRIPAFMTKDNPGEDTAVLLITFESPDGACRVTPQLYLSPRVEHVLGGSENLRIPAFPPSGCLIDYIPVVCELITNKVELIVGGFEKRKECISAFLSLYGRCVVEYDAEAFTTAKFLMEWHDFFFGFTVGLPTKFPKEGPQYHFESVYHEAEDGRPYCKTYNIPPHSPRWTGNEIADRAKAYIMENVANFQRGSVAEGSLRQ